MTSAKILMLGTDISTMGGIASVVKDYFDYGLMSRLNVTYMATHRDGSKIGKALFYLGQIPRIIAKMPSVQIVHIHTSHGWSFRRLFVLLMVAHALGRKTVLHVHGSQFDACYEKAGRIERALICYGLRKSDVVIALSAAWKDKLSSMEPAAKIVVVRNSVDVAKYRREDRVLHVPVTVLFLGRLGERKGIYDLLKAIENLDSSQFRFVLAGDGEVERVRDIVKEKGWARHVEVPGWVGQAEKTELLRDADIYVLPSYQEGLPISILEAMAAGLPVISTPVGGIPEAVIDGKNGYLVTPGDHLALAKCIEKIGMNVGLWKEMGMASYALAEERFGMTQVESELNKIYQSFFS